MSAVTLWLSHSLAAVIGFGLAAALCAMKREDKQ